MKINEVSVSEFKWKSSYFVVGLLVDPCMFGKCLTDTWLKRVKARKKNSSLLKTACIPHSAFETQFLSAPLQRNPK